MVPECARWNQPRSPSTEADSVAFIYALHPHLKGGVFVYSCAALVDQHEVATRLRRRSMTIVWHMRRTVEREANVSGHINTDFSQKCGPT